MMAAELVYQGVWRTPDEESLDLYPGLVVHDGRMSGSITFGVNRTPLWAPQIRYVDADDYHIPEPTTITTAEDFMRDLLQMRGEFARLLLVLADAERCEQRRDAAGPPWWSTKRHRKRVSEQLRRCLDVLDIDGKVS